MSQLAAEQTDQEPKNGGARIPNKGSLQAYAQNFTKEAIDCLVNIMRTTRNESLKMGAAKVLLDKGVPDLKATELSTGDNSPLLIKIVSEQNGNQPTNKELSEAAVDL